MRQLARHLAGVCYASAIVAVVVSATNGARWPLIFAAAMGAAGSVIAIATALYTER